MSENKSSLSEARSYEEMGESWDNHDVGEVWDQTSFDGDPSYYRTAKLMSWSRGGYFFYADASSPSVLDRFMKAFPF